MGHHRFKPSRHERYREPDAYHDEEDGYGYRDRRSLPALNIPGSVIVAGLVLWSALALGVWWLVDPVLAWISGAAGPLVDTGAGFANWFGLGAEANALRDAANIEGLVGWAMGPVHFLAKAALLSVWVVGLIGLTVLPAVLRRRRAAWD